MGLQEVLANMFGLGGGPQPQPANSQYSPEIQALLQQAGYAPEDPGQAKHRAIAQGLAAFGKNLASSKQDFLPALGEALPTGAESYLKAREGQEDDRRKASLDLLKQVFGFDKAQDTQDYRMGTLDERMRHNQVGEGQTGQKIEINLKGLEERGRHNKVTEGQGDTRLDQGQQKIDETQAYHGILDENADDKTAIMQKRVEDAFGNNQERIKQGWDRIKLQSEAGKRDAARLKAQLEGGMYTKDDKGVKGVDSVKARNGELETRAKILRLLKEKAHLMGIDDADQKYREPDAYAAGQLEFEQYAKTLYAEFGYDEKGMPLPNTAQPVPQPNEVTQPAPANPAVTAPPPAQSGGQTTGMGSRTDPVSGITSQDQFAALPSGTWFINPSDGKPYRKK